ncbi:hypothetical protein NGUA15_03904 [Salmonella enterica]|nr:hypothetical protein NGUA15_03904 [Salmonella enterica]
MGNLTGFFIIFGFEGSLTNQLTFTAKPGVFFANHIEEGGENNGEDIRNGQNSNSR